MPQVKDDFCRELLEMEDSDWIWGKMECDEGQVCVETDNTLNDVLYEDRNHESMNEANK